MDGADRAGDDRTFRINFGREGTARLRERVMERLKEIMGDYTDDTLVEYVLVLLRNGRSKEEARRELNVFLGDDSVSFVSWLWNHLYSSMHLYAQPEVLLSEDVTKSNWILDDQYGGHKPQQEYVHGNVKSDSEDKREDLSKTSKSRHNKDWKGLVEENNQFPLRSTVTRVLHSEERKNIRDNVKQSLSPRPQIGKKRSRDDGRQPRKYQRDAAPRPVIGASCRLLQFAVRDAVKTVQQASTRTEPDSKRLRSVVSTSMEESFLDERPQRLRSVARVPGTLSTALKAAAEAAEDVTKDRGTGSVFDRLSHDAYVGPIEQSSMEPMLEELDYENPNQNPESDHAEYYQRSEYDGNFSGDMMMPDRVAALPDDSASYNDGYNVALVRNQDLNTSQSAVYANRDKKSLTLQHSVAQNANEVVENTRMIDQDPHSSAIAKASSKAMNISVNVNTWKSPHFQVSKDVSKAGNRDAVDRGDLNAEKNNVHQLKENHTAVTKNEIARVDIQKEPQNKGTVTSAPGSYTTSRPCDDVDSRTVFVSNVHFAATKDSLSRHFNKFGEVLKVIIVSDAATGQPKGSAYVEFLRKESAESALSLNGTSFLSRSLKVVRKSSIHSESAPIMSWPHIARASPFASRVSRSVFSRGVIPGAFRARLPIKPRARSLQWKRENSAADGTKNTLNNNVSSLTGRNLTYIRPVSKVDASSGPA